MERFRRSLRIFQNNTKDDHSYTKGRQPPQRLQPRFRQLSDNIPRHYFPLCTAAQKSTITRLGTAIPLYQGLVRRFGYKARTPIKTQIVSLSAFLFGGGEGSRTPVRKQFHGMFSGRRRLFRAALPPCSPPGGQAATPTGQVRVIMHGTVNSFRTHVHCETTPSLSRSPLKSDGCQQLGSDS